MRSGTVYRSLLCVGLAIVLVAYAMDGKPPGTDGFAELIVFADKLAGRWVKDIVSVTVGDPASSGAVKG